MTALKFLLDITAKVGTENMFSQKLWNNNLQDTNNYHHIIRVSNFQAQISYTWMSPDRKTHKLMSLDRWKSDSNGVLA
jgi:hypothetical protein